MAPARPPPDNAASAAADVSHGEEGKEEGEERREGERERQSVSRKQSMCITTTLTFAKTLQRVKAAVSLPLMTPPPMLLCSIAESAALLHPFGNGSKGFKRRDDLGRGAHAVRLVNVPASE